MKINSLSRPKSLTEITYERLKAAILDDEIELGAQLSELKLSKSLGVSKTPIREALQELRREGLVHVDPQRGSFVFSLTEQEIDQICTLRSILEVGAAQRLYEVGRTRTINKLEKIVDGMVTLSQKGDARGYVKLDSEFHQAIVEGAQNRYLVAAYRPLSAQVEAMRARNLKSAEVLKRSVDVHRSILETLRQENLEAFLQTTRQHIEQSRLDFLDWLQRSTNTE
ncbi:GntR family transcriptional regulator [Cognatishimia maritima]|uniref:DNA-binding transcriptional regulator, GntR family n=1 Tax=Cognatishimia maritima TaxID=870908 RepID=A0A1M5QXQ6_9RHOB|nr:GntR family transcriptional regulator [Cognatishimia maritima]SHH18333.1 DNA-binding transcriptional regulator, GntR family [Cognatishimia maritima]